MPNNPFRFVAGAAVICIASLFGSAVASARAEEELDFDRFAKPDHQSLLRMYYAAQGDLLREHFPFGIELLTVFQLPPLASPPGPSSKSIERGFDSEWYKLSEEYVSNEFARKKFQQQVIAAAPTLLQKVDGGKKIDLFRLRWEAPLAAYDFAEQRFPLAPDRFMGLNYGSDRFSHESVVVPRAFYSAEERRDFSRTAVGLTFRKNFVPSSLLPQSFVGKRRTGVFTLTVAGLEGLKELPMSPEAAETLLTQLTDESRGQRANRSVVIEGLVRIGPFGIQEGKLEPVPAQVVAARVLHPLTDREVHRFSDSLFSSEEAVKEANGIAAGADVQGIPYLSRMRMALLQFRDHPELLDTSRLDNLTRSQIQTEQKSWQRIDELAKELQRQKELTGASSQALNPRRPFFTFEWQALREEGKKLADGPLLEIFAGNDAYWSFVKEEPNWDPRFDVVVAPFLFARSRVEGKSVEAAQLELLPHVKNFVAEAARRIPDQLAIPVRLPPLILDASRTALVPDPSYGSGRDGKLALLIPVYAPAIGEPREKPGIGYPNSVRAKTLYQVKSFPESTPIEGEIAKAILDKCPETGLGARAVSRFRSGATFLTNYPAAVALDRELVFDRIPLRPATVQEFTDNEYLRRNSGENAFEAQIVLAAIRVELATEFEYDGTTRPRGVIVGEVQGVRVVTKEGKQVAFISATELPESVPIPDNNPFAPEPGDQAASGGLQELTPAMIPMLIARYQPEFFQQHLDQFIVTRLQHEYWFRTNPAKNTYGVNPALGEAFPAVNEMPDAAQRRQLAGRFKTWMLKNNNLGTRFTLRFGEVSFENRNGGDSPSPALLGGMAGSPFDNALGRAMTTHSIAVGQLESERRFNNSIADTPDRTVKAWTQAFAKVEAWTQALAIAPPEIHFSERRYHFIVPDSNGERALPGNQASMGGNAAAQVAGIPIARPDTEPIRPVLRVDKEIWLPKDAALSSANQRLQLELEMNATEVEVLDEPPPHPWVEACFRHSDSNSFHPELLDYRKLSDGGQYMILHVALQNARLINADTGETVLPLVLKNYRTIKNAPKAMAKSLVLPVQGNRHHRRRWVQHTLPDRSHLCMRFHPAIKLPLAFAIAVPRLPNQAQIVTRNPLTNQSSPDTNMAFRSVGS